MELFVDKCQVEMSVGKQRIARKGFFVIGNRWKETPFFFENVTEVKVGRQVIRIEQDRFLVALLRSVYVPPLVVYVPEVGEGIREAWPDFEGLMVCLNGKIECSRY